VLLDGLQSRQPEVQGSAAEGLGGLGSNAAVAVPALIAVLNSTNDRVCLRTLFALHRIQSRPELVVPAIVRLLSNTNRSVRGEVLFCLEKFGSNAKAAAPEVVRCLQDPEPLVRTWAIVSLNGISPETAEAAGVDVQTLLGQLGSGDKTNRFARIFALRYLKPKAELAIPALAKCLQDTNAEIRYFAAGVLAVFGTNAVPTLQKALQDQDADVRGRATNALQEIFSPRFD
jgi:HEAT repeat protein